MYRHEPLSPLITDKCDTCQFCVWDNERHKYGCAIRGCSSGEKFIEYKGIGDNNDKS